MEENSSPSRSLLGSSWTGRAALLVTKTNGSRCGHRNDLGRLPRPHDRAATFKNGRGILSDGFDPNGKERSQAMGPRVAVGMNRRPAAARWGGLPKMRAARTGTANGSSGGRRGAEGATNWARSPYPSDILAAQGTRRRCRSSQQPRAPPSGRKGSDGRRAQRRPRP